MPLGAPLLEITARKDMVAVGENTEIVPAMENIVDIENSAVIESRIDCHTQLRIFGIGHAGDKAHLRIIVPPIGNNGSRLDPERQFRTVFGQQQIALHRTVTNDITVVQRHFQGYAVGNDPQRIILSGTGIDPIRDTAYIFSYLRSSIAHSRIDIYELSRPKNSIGRSLKTRFVKFRLIEHLQ